MAQQHIRNLVVFQQFLMLTYFLILQFIAPTRTDAFHIFATSKHQPMRVQSSFQALAASSNNSEELDYITASSENQIFHRRDIFRRIVAASGAILTSSFYRGGVSNNIALAAEVDQVKNEFVQYESTKDKFSIEIPTGFKVTSKIGSPVSMNKGKGERIFSAIDLKSGTVITVHRERACDISDYISKPEQCSLILPNKETDAPLMSKETLQKDAIKMLIRHDDRDNTALGGTSTLRTVEMVDADIGGGKAAYLVADTVLPTGGTYRDDMGLMKEKTFTRVVKARVVSQEGNENGVSLLGIWVSSPQDEWQNPAMGTRLNRIMESIHLESGRDIHN